MLQHPIFLIPLLCLSAWTASVQAQPPPAKQNPLIPGQAAKGAAAGCSTTEASSCAEAAAKILPIVMGPSPLEENLRRLTDEIGGRVTGSAQMAKAVDWAVAAFRSAGIDVHTEKYILPITWAEGDTRLEMLAPEKFPVRLVAEGWSPSTPAGGIEANLIDLQDGSVDAFARAGSIKGAILLVHSETGSTWGDLFKEYSLPPAIIDRA